MVEMTGFEPATPWSQTKCSTKLSHFSTNKKNMVRSKGFEPLTFWFVAKHSIQLSYERMITKSQSFILTIFNKKWWLRMESNHRHEDFQSSALPTELQRQNWRPGTGSNRRPLA